MQSNKITDHDLVKSCMRELCMKRGFTDGENMMQRDLQFLCEQIEVETGVLISLSTIKRLLNGQFSRIPQIATLDAITKTLGYQNWQHYKSSFIPKSKTTVSKKHGPGYSKFVYAGCCLLLIAFIFFSLIKHGATGIAGTNKASFSFIKTDGNNLPNTVVFNYDVAKVVADSFFIQQSWDKNKKVKIDKNSHTLTDIYYEPGFHEAKLIANDQIIKTVDVSIPTDRWFFYGKEKLFGGLPKYFPSANGISNGALQLTVANILKGKMDIQKDNMYLQVYFPSKINGNSDNFVLKFRIKVNQVNDGLCPFFVSEVFCQHSFMYFSSTLKGCTGQLSMEFSEKHLSGKTNDLAAFGSDIKSWQNVELVVKNKAVSIKINDRQVFSTSYQESCGAIKGIGFISNGLCAVDFVDLTGLNGEPIYSNDFNGNN